MKFVVTWSRLRSVVVLTLLAARGLVPTTLRSLERFSAGSPASTRSQRDRAECP
jgi:hypothetical protein